MGRQLGRVGGASAGTIAIVFGVLELLHKTPPAWVVLTLGAAAILGVVADYLWEQRGGDKSAVKQTQRIGRNSVGMQAGRDNFQAGRDNRNINIGERISREGNED